MAKLVCMTLPYMGVSFERALEGISRAGYKYISFGLPHAGKDYPDEDDPQTVVKLQRLFDKYELQPLSLVSNDQLKPGESLERARKRLETAKALGVEEVLSVGTWNYVSFPDEQLPEEEQLSLHQAFVERFKQVGHMAEELGVKVTIKPHSGNTATAKHIKDTLAEIGSSAVGASYDPGNVHYYEGLDSVQDMPIIADQLISLIAKDHRGERANGDFPIPGDGDVDFPALFRMLKEADFSGLVTVERIDGTNRNWTVEQIDQRLLQARVQLENMLQQAGLSE